MEKILTVKLFQQNEVHIRNTCDGNIFLMPTCGGSYEGGIGTGKVEAIGMTTSYCPCPGRNDLESRVLLTTQDDEHIVLDMKAYLNLSPEDEERLQKQEAVTHENEKVYSKGTVSFQTGSDKYREFERKVFVCEVHLEDWETFVMDIYDVG